MNKIINHIFCCMALLLGSISAAQAQCPIQFSYNTTSNNTAYFQAAPTPGATQNDSYVWSIYTNTGVDTIYGFYPQYQFAASGYYIVCVDYTSSTTGCTASFCDSIDINAGSGSNCNNARVEFWSALDAQNNPILNAYAYGMSGNVTYTWDFGATGTPAPASLSMEGTMVCVTATNGNCTAVYCDSVQPFPCNIQVNPSHQAQGNVVNFYANLATGPYLFNWSYIDPNGTTVWFSNQENPIHTFPSSANGAWYSIMVMVQDTLYGCQTIGYDSIYVQSGSACNNLMLSLNFDNFASETSWDVTDAQGVIVASGGNYTSANNGDSLNVWLCLPDGCYTLNMYDSWGDGMCCAYGNGSYALFEASPIFWSTLAQGGNFGSQASHVFCLGSGQSYPCHHLQNAQIQVQQGAGGSVQLGTSIPSSMNNVQYQWTIAQSSNGQVVASSGQANWNTTLANGNYLIHLVLVDSFCRQTLTAPVTITNASNSTCNGIVANMNIYQDPTNPFQIYVVPTLANVPTSYNFQFYWQFGNQQYVGIPAHNFNGYGSFAICYTAQDSLSGCTITYCDSITIDSSGNMSRSPQNKYQAQVLPPVISYLTTTTAVKQSTWQLELFPNPAQHNLQVRLETPTAVEAQLQIVDLMGQSVYQQSIQTQGSTQLSVDVEHLPAGMYLLQVVSETEQQTLRFVKQ